MDLEAATILLYSEIFRAAAPLRKARSANSEEWECDGSLRCALPQLEHDVDEAEGEDCRAEEVHSRPSVIPVRPVPLPNDVRERRKYAY